MRPGAGIREDLGQRDTASGPLRHRTVRYEGTESAGPELDAAHRAHPGQRLGEQAEPDTRDLAERGRAAEVLEDDVHRRVRHDMGDMRFGQVPVDEPVVLQIRTERGRRCAAAEPDACEQLGGVDDAPGIAPGAVRRAGRRA